MADLSLFSGAPPVAGINETLGQWAEDFIGVFRQGAASGQRPPHVREGVGSVG